ncbi:Protein pelota like protein [Dictyocoela muelleri]|nr:Protein pelota like protein [Dictyocoela muelleri]
MKILNINKNQIAKINQIINSSINEIESTNEIEQTLNKSITEMISPTIQIIKLSPDHIDDIYSLYNLIEKDDLVKSKTSRKIQIGSKQIKTFLELEIKVEKTNVDLQCSSLTISGKINYVYDNSLKDKIRIGTNHSLNITIDDYLKITKTNWSLKSLNALKSILNKDEYIVFVCYKEIVDSYKVLFNHNFNDEKNYKYYKMKNSKIDNFNKDEKVIIVDCGGDVEFKNFFTKSKLIRVDKDKIDKQNFNKKLKNVKNKKLDSQSIIEYILKNYNFGFKNKNMKNVNFKNLFFKNQSLQIFGLAEIYESLEYDALSSVLIQKEIFKSFDVDKRREIENLKKRVEELNVNFYVVEEKDEFWEKLEEFGGVVGILKFSYK